MALPIILVDSTDGASSDTAASGAGPSTALTGSSAATDGAGTVCTLDGSPDLSGVATDGSHVIYLADATAGQRNFGKITAKDDGADTVTVSTAFAVSQTGQTWAIGGVRATISGGTSLKLIDNNGGTGDMEPGWIAELQSGHAETASGDFEPRGAGDETNGPKTLRGESGAGTKPILTLSGSGSNFITRSAGWLIKDFSIAGAGGAVNCIVDVGLKNRYEGLTISGFSGVLIDGASSAGVELTQIMYCFLDGGSSAVRVKQNAQVKFCRCRNQTSDAILGSDAMSGVTITDNVIDTAGGDGISITQTRTDEFGAVEIARNQIYLSTGDGIQYAGENDSLCGLSVHQNILSENGAYGINFSGITANQLLLRGAMVEYNAFYSNSSGLINISGVNGNGVTLTADPFVDKAAEDFNINNTTNGGATLRTTTLTVPE